MKQKLQFIANCFIAVIIAVGIYDSYKTHQEVDRQADTIIVRDTFVFSSPVPTSTQVVGSKFVYLPKVCLREGVAVTDTLRDSVLVDVPIERKTYTDDSTYTAKVSGFMVNLDEIEVYRQKEVVTIREKYKPWSLGIGAGLGYNGKVEPYIGVSVHYKLWEW